MTRGIRRFISLALLACAIVSSTGVRSDGGLQSDDNQAAANPQVASSLIQVHIRRLHLVRPDLIHYPIAYEVVC
jgi:hypothetical protein